jgi:hypothetical protein
LLRLVYYDQSTLRRLFTPYIITGIRAATNYKNVSFIGLIVSGGESGRWKTTINHNERRGYIVSYTPVTETHRGTQSPSPSLHPRQHHYLHGKHPCMFAANTAVCNPSKHNTSKTVAVATSRMCTFNSETRDMPRGH